MILLCASVYWIWLSILFNAAAARLVGRCGVKFIKVVGLATYPIYLVHDLAGAVLVRWLVQFRLHDDIALFIAVSFIVSSSIVIVQFAEPPVRLILTSIMDRLLAAFGPLAQKRLMRPTFSAVGGRALG